MIWIIMPVYNTEKYLEEAIESILGQTIFYQDDIRLLLLDDASRDGSLAICKKYEKQYPDKIRVIHFENNRGVSRVRNYGLSLCAKEPGAVVGFVDSDDRLAPDVLEKVRDYFRAHPSLCIASTEIHYFEAAQGENKMNWRFREREVVDISKDYMYPQYYIGGVFFQKRALKMLHFDEDMAFWEDAMAINRLILQEGKYGLVKGAVYWYRKRQDESSLVDRAWHDKKRYAAFLEDGYLKLMNDCRKKKLRVIPYIQFVVAYHLRLFMLPGNEETVNEMVSQEELAGFRKKIKKILKKIRVSVIIRVPTTLPVLEAMLSIRSGRKVRARRTYTEDDCIFSFRGYELTRMSQRKVRLVASPDSPDSEGMWRGRFDTPIYQMTEEDSIFAVRGKERVDAIRRPCRKKIYVLGDKMRNYRYAGFALEVPKQWDRAVFGIHTNGIDILLNEVIFEEEAARIKEKRRENESNDESE